MTQPAEPPAGNRLRVLLVDDSSAFLETISRFLAVDVHVDIVGRATSGGDALEQVRQLGPDLVLMDLAMDGMNGLDATRRLKMQRAPPAVIILTVHDDDAYREAAKAMRADGFLCKSDVGELLLPMIAGLVPSRPPVRPETEP